METERANKSKCKQCGTLATWMYMPGADDATYCDNCVPSRGCSCQDGALDDQGRGLPCCEYDYDAEGFTFSDE